VTPVLIAAIVPTLVVLIGILLNRQDAISIRSDLKTESGQLRSELKTEIGQLRAEITTLRDNIHRDMVGLHERIAVVEAKQPR